MDDQPLNWAQPAEQAQPETTDAQRKRQQRRRRIGAGAGLAAGGAVVGAVLAGTLPAGAASPSTSTGTPASGEAPAGYGTGGSGPAGHGPDGRGPGEHGPDGHALDLTGTVTAVGSSSVTIKTSSGTTVTYAVNSKSDIDKNGEAQLSSLVVGDKVRYSVVSGTKTIAILHAGDEAKDMPARPPGGSMPNMPRPSGAPGSPAE